MKDAKFYVYNVGHGVCTLLTGTREVGGSEVPYCGIFDCGTKIGFGHIINKEIIIDMIEKIHQNGSTQIDDVVISHQDTDHWSMLLGLFAMINGEDVEFQTTTFNHCFGMNQEEAWWIRSFKGGCSLSTLKNNNYTKECYNKSGDYNINVAYDEEKLVWMVINVYQTGFSSGIELCSVESGTCTVRLSFSDKKLNKTINVEWIPSHETPLLLFANEIIDEICKLPVKFSTQEFLQNVLLDMAYSFDLGKRAELGSLIDNCTQITTPIINLTLGGSLISPKYHGLISMFVAICKYNSEVSHIRRCYWGAYAIMRENRNNVFERSFPCDNLRPINFDKLQQNIQRNLTSVVLQFDINDNEKLVLPGDVTIHAFPELIKRFTDEYEVPRGSLKLFLAPHHGSDETNVNTEDFASPIISKHPLNCVFEALEANRCNLVISASNEFDSHPGIEFITRARRLIKDEKEINKHAYAYGVNTPTIKEIQIYVDKRRIYTTNCLVEEELYYVYENGNVSGKTIPVSAEPALTRASRRRLPPDNTFI